MTMRKGTFVRVMQEGRAEALDLAAQDPPATPSTLRAGVLISVKLDKPFLGQFVALRLVEQGDVDIVHAGVRQDGADLVGEALGGEVAHRTVGGGVDAETPGDEDQPALDRLKGLGDAVHDGDA